MIVVFDVDGVLLDSAPLIRLAYQRAGARDVPDDVLAMQGVPWLRDRHGDDAPVIKEAKNRIYLEMLRRERLPWISGMSAAAVLRHSNVSCGVITAAPSGTLSILRARIGGAWPFTLVEADGVPPTEKMELLDLLQPRVHAVYVDDQPVDVPDGWAFVRYTRQTTVALLREIFQ